MSEINVSPKMEQFWDDGSSSRGGLNHHGGLNLGIGGGGGIICTGGGSPTGSHDGGGISGHNQYERNLNFATGAVDDNEYGFPKKKTVRDPLSHRIIEKRRRDRMNNCLADLARLLPPSSLRKGRGRIEKTEIVELAIRHLRHLQTHLCPSGDKCEFNYIVKGSRAEVFTRSPISLAVSGSGEDGSTFPSTPEEHFRLGLHECMSEIMHFLVEEEGMYPGDSLCVRILNHLSSHAENLMREHFGKEGKLRFLNEIKKEEMINPKKSSCDSDCNNGSSSSSGYAGNGSSLSGSDGNGGQDSESFPIPTGSINGTHSTLSERTVAINIDYEGENSCSSTQLSLDISDVLSVESKSTASRSANNNKPPIPTIICSTSSMISSHAMLTSSNGRSSDEGHETDSPGSNSTHHQYKFKNNIKQRFVADLVLPEVEVESDKKQGNDNIKVVDNKKSRKESSQEANNASVQSDFEDEESGTNKQGIISPREIMIEDDCVSNKSYSNRRASNSSNRTISIGNIDCEGSTPPPPPFTKLGTLSCGVNSDNSCLEGAGELHARLLKLEKNKTVLKPPQPINLCSESATLGESCSSFLTNNNNNGRVPAFALHEKGLFYIPLTIDKSLLSQCMTTKLDQHGSSSPPPLHPVTISVCFLLAQDDKSVNSHLLKAPIPYGNIIPEVNPIISEKFGQHANMRLPVITPNPILSLAPGGRSLKSPKSPNHPKELVAAAGANNRHSQQSKQYSTIANYRYPISGSSSSSSGGPNLQQSPHNNHNSKDLYSSSHAQYYPVGYYPNPTNNSHHHHHQLSPPTTGLVPPLPPSHINGGYSSSSSSSTSSGNGGGNNNHVRQNIRKRSIASVSPISGSSSSLGYHSSFHDNTSQDGFPNGYPTMITTHQYSNSPGGSQLHRHVNNGLNISISSNNNRQHSASAVMGLHHHFGGYHHHGLSTSHLSLPFETHGGNCMDLEQRRRSCSPNKRAKRIRDGDDTLKSKPMIPLGLPIISLPANK